MNIRVVLLTMVVGLAACGDEDGSQPPVAVEDRFTVEEDAPIEIDVLANDTDPQGLPLVLSRASATGREVTIEGSVVRVAPKPDFNGTFDLTYAVTNGDAVGYGRAVVTVTPVNDAPVATPQTVGTGRNTPRTLLLEGTDVDGDILTFEVETRPAHGALSGTGSAIVYTPSSDFAGTDTVVFRARDATAVSAPATISIRVSGGVAPVATTQWVSTAEDASKEITLTATDAEQDPVTFRIVEQPAHGTLTGTPPNVTYTPSANYFGSDRFTFVAEDALLSSTPATVWVDVTKVNDAPVAQMQAASGTEDQPITITLAGSDIDGDALTYAIVTNPQRGSVSSFGGATFSYRPNANYNGTDSFTFSVSDGKATSEPATVTLSIAAVADPPRATAQSVALAEDSSQSIVLAGTDPDGDTLTFAIATSPAHGTLTGVLPRLEYKPAANYHGTDTFTFTANDGTATSAPVAVSITVSPVNDVPVIAGAALSGNEGANISIPLPTTDIDGDVLTYSVVTPPAHGTVSTGGVARYNSQDFNGNVSFALAASDGKGGTSAPATFTVAVAPAPDAPRPRDDVGILTVGQPLRLSVLANDEEVDGDTMSLVSATAPAHGTVQLDGDELVYTTTPANTGPVTFTYTVTDTTGLTATAKVTVGIGAFPVGMPVGFVGHAVSVTNTWEMFLQHDISSDGRYVAFLSPLALTPGDTNQLNDVYLWDRTTLAYERISVGASGAVANGGSELPSISADGRYVAFASAANNLVANDTNNTIDVFVRDRVTGTTVRVSVDSTGAQVSGHSSYPDISADGRVVAFASAAFQLVPNDGNGEVDIFVRDLTAGVTSRVSVATGGGEAELLSVSPALSGDGKVVAFVSTASNLVAGDTNGKPDVFVHDRTSGVTSRISVSSNGGEANNASRSPAISYDGRIVAFNTTANNLVPQSGPGTYVRDRQTGVTLTTGVYASNLSLSADGRYLVGHEGGDTFVRDRIAAQTHHYSSGTTTDIRFPVISSNGRYLAVLSTHDLDSQSRGAGTKVYVYANPL